MYSDAEQKVRDLEDLIRQLWYQMRIDRTAADKLAQDSLYLRPGPIGDLEEEEECTGTVTFNVECGGTPLSGFTVEVTRASSPVATGTTNGSGQYVLSLGEAGTYDYEISKTGWVTETGSFDFVCGESQTINVTVESEGVLIEGRVTGCNPGAGYSFDPGIASTSVSSSGAWTGSATTDSLGYYSLFVPVSTGTITLTVAVSKYKTVTKTVSITCGVATVTATNGNESTPGLNFNFLLDVDANHVCIGCCKDPVKKTLTFESDLATFDLSYTGVISGFRGSDETADVACLRPNCSSASAFTTLTFLLRTTLTNCEASFECAMCLITGVGTYGLRDAGASGSPEWFSGNGLRAWFYVEQEFSCSPFTVTGTIYELFPGEDPSSDPVPYIYGISGSCSSQTDRSWAFTITEAP